MKTEIKQLLESVKNGIMTVDEALLQIKTKPFEDVGYAKVDLHRKARQGVAEVIYGAGKTATQMIGIIETMQRNGQNCILITRLSPTAADEIREKVSLRCFPEAHIGIIGEMPKPDGIGKIVIATG